MFCTPYSAIFNFAPEIEAAADVMLQCILEFQYIVFVKQINKRRMQAVFSAATDPENRVFKYCAD